MPLLSLIGERGAIRSTLTTGLNELESAGLIHRETFAEMPPRVEYSLTEEGERLRKSLPSLSRLAARK
ncbi:MAG TPA: winged helix-turn-helix transcriptional regulator [Blastocatellia bacterium]|nr:winged helix-turn-helix transcriptional regulator [Blastocatellia bacterium]